MTSLNKVQLIGHLGKDPELRETNTGKQVCNFSIATTNANKKEVEWHKIICWEKLAENSVKYLKKGSLAFVEGRIASRQYEKDGTKHTAYEIVAHSVLFLSSSKDKEEKKEENFDDLPF